MGEKLGICDSCHGPRVTPPYLYGLCGAVEICKLCFDNETPESFRARRAENLKKLETESFPNQNPRI